jgi:hypothetical protein
MDPNELLAGVFQLEDEIMEYGVDCTHTEELTELARSILELELDQTDKIELEKRLGEFQEFHTEFGCDSDNFYKLWNVCMDILSRICHPLTEN